MFKNLWEKRKNRGAEELWSVAGNEKMSRGKRWLKGIISRRKRSKSGLAPTVNVHAQRAAWVLPNRLNRIGLDGKEWRKRYIPRVIEKSLNPT